MARRRNIIRGLTPDERRELAHCVRELSNPVVANATAKKATKEVAVA